MKYFRILISTFKTSAIADMEYRANFALQILVDIIWYLSQIAMYEVIFANTKLIGDWNVSQVRVFNAIIFIVDAFFMLSFQTNLSDLPDKISKGELDLVLAKPVESQFIVSFFRFNTAYILNIFITFGWLFYCLSHVQNLVWLNSLWLIIFIPCGILISYSIRFMLITLNLIFVRADNLQYIWYSMYRFAMRPDSIYFPWLRVILFSLFPMAFIASVPTRVLFEPNQPLYLILALMLSTFFLYLSHLFWNFGLKHYSSASS